jgi:hypothetical protein
MKRSVVNKSVNLINISIDLCLWNIFCVWIKINRLRVRRIMGMIRQIKFEAIVRFDRALIGIGVFERRFEDEFWPGHGGEKVCELQVAGSCHFTMTFNTSLQISSEHTVTAQIWSVYTSFNSRISPLRVFQVLLPRYFVSSRLNFQHHSSRLGWIYQTKHESFVKAFLGTRSPS